MSEQQRKLEMGDYEYIVSQVQTRFVFTEHYLREDGSVEFRIQDVGGAKEKFKDLLALVKPKGLMALLRRINGDAILAIGKGSVRAEYKRTLPLILLIATLLTVAIDGWFRTADLPGQNSLVLTALYTSAIMGIIGIHELGHIVISRIHKMKSSLPYFIPGIPRLIPTMGAVITSAEPPVNRDSLFDLGLSGPVAGLIVTVIVAAGGALTSYSLPESAVLQQIQSGNLQPIARLDLFTEFLLSIFGMLPAPEGQTLIISPLVYAAALGFLVTFLNLMPAWQLDGGHIARAVLDRKQHRIATFATVAILFLLRFDLMAVLILVLSLRTPDMRPLDDVSPLSRLRKFAFLGIMASAFLIYFVAIRCSILFFGIC